uniref:Uncharacterized protein n=1 Tax=Parascaris equorum TaxID=6256 RepID=A0A914S1R5_PAREQ
MDTEEWLQIEFPSEVYPPAYMLEYWRSSLGSWARYKDSQHNEVSCFQQCISSRMASATYIYRIEHSQRYK